MVSEHISSDSSCVRPSALSATGRFDLRDRVVVVTGASKGIGRELTVLLAETGAVVVPTVRTDAEAVSGIVAAQGGIDVLINNAGLGFARAAFE
jgi:NAD(P)-dependent dehydrogenase (short-subunit alcohol dehydrogenase family)